MRTRLIGLVVVVASVAVLSWSMQGLPPDIHPESLSRLPPVQRDALDEAGKAVFDRVAGARGMPRTGPGAVTMYSPGHRRADSGSQSVPAEDGGRQPLLRAVRAHRCAGIRSAVRMVGPRTGGAAGRARAIGDRRRQVQQGRRRAVREGCDGDSARTRDVPRSQGELGAVGERPSSSSGVRAPSRSSRRWPTM